MPHLNLTTLGAPRPRTRGRWPGDWRAVGDIRGGVVGSERVAALRVAERLGPCASVATLIVDSGFCYVSTDVYAQAAR